MTKTALLLASMILLWQLGHPMAVGARLDRPAPNFPSKGYASNIIVMIFSQARVPGGLVQEDPCGTSTVVVLKPGERTFRERLDEVVAQMPGYRVIYSEHVVDVVPAAGLPRLLRTALPRTTYQGTSREVLGNVLAAPAVKVAIERLGIRAIHDGGLSSSPGDHALPERHFKLISAPASLFTTMNRAAVTVGDGVWVISLSKCRRFTVMGAGFGAGGNFWPG